MMDPEMTTSLKLWKRIPANPYSWDSNAAAESEKWLLFVIGEGLRHGPQANITGDDRRDFH